MNNLKLKLRNDWEMVKKDWWHWSVFLDDGGSGDIEKVDYVDYVLHPTFPNPRRTIRDRTTHFKLSTSGWGTFMIRAFVHTKNNEKIKIDHTLVLKYDPPQGVTD
jgi:transcription initiation factor IIF auxiliary subunit